MSLRNPELLDARLVKDIDAMTMGDGRWRLIFGSLEMRRQAASYLKLLDTNGNARDFKDDEMVMGETLAIVVIQNVTGKPLSA